MQRRLTVVENIPFVSLQFSRILSSRLFLPALLKWHHKVVSSKLQPFKHFLEFYVMMLKKLNKMKGRCRIISGLLVVSNFSRVIPKKEVKP